MQERFRILKFSCALTQIARRRQISRIQILGKEEGKCLSLHEVLCVWLEQPLRPAVRLPAKSSGLAAAFSGGVPTPVVSAFSVQARRTLQPAPSRLREITLWFTLAKDASTPYSRTSPFLAFLWCFTIRPWWLGLVLERGRNPVIQFSACCRRTPGILAAGRCWAFSRRFSLTLPIIPAFALPGQAAFPHSHSRSRRQSLNLARHRNLVNQ